MLISVIYIGTLMCTPCHDSGQVMKFLCILHARIFTAKVCLGSIQQHCSNTILPISSDSDMHYHTLTPVQIQNNRVRSRV